MDAVKTRIPFMLLYIINNNSTKETHLILRNNYFQNQLHRLVQLIQNPIHLNLLPKASAMVKLESSWFGA